MTLNLKQKRFADEYVVDLNATQAAIRAGYSEKTAYSQGQRLLKHVEVQERISRNVQKRAERTEIDADWVVGHLSHLIKADPNELTSIVVSACRYCHGHGHAYQWRTEQEFEAASEAYWELPDEARAKRVAPTMSGGFGYSMKLAPHADCPNCEGFGIPRTVLRDTTNLSPSAQALFAGVKETQNGLEVKTHDKMRALEMLARHLGMFPSKVELTGKGGGPVETINTNMTPQEAAESYAATLGRNEG